MTSSEMGSVQRGRREPTGSPTPPPPPLNPTLTSQPRARRSAVRPHALRVCRQPAQRLLLRLPPTPHPTPPIPQSPVGETCPSVLTLLGRCWRAGDDGWGQERGVRCGSGSNEEEPGVTSAFPGVQGTFTSVFLGPGGRSDGLWPQAGDMPTSRKKAGFPGKGLSLPRGWALCSALGSGFAKWGATGGGLPHLRQWLGERYFPDSRLWKQALIRWRRQATAPSWVTHTSYLTLGVRLTSPSQGSSYKGQFKLHDWAR